MQGTRPFPGFPEGRRVGSLPGSLGAIRQRRALSLLLFSRPKGGARAGPTWLLPGLALGRRGPQPSSPPWEREVCLASIGELAFKVGIVISKGETLLSLQGRVYFYRQ